MPTHSTTHGGDILATRGTTGTGTYATIPTIGAMATTHIIQVTIHIIQAITLTHTTLHVRHSTDMAQVIDLEVVMAEEMVI